MQQKNESQVFRPDALEARNLWRVSGFGFRVERQELLVKLS